MRYLACPCDKGLLFGNHDSGVDMMVGFVDLDCAGNLDTRKCHT